MDAVYSTWSPDFVVQLARDYVLPCVGGGFVLGAMGYIVGLVVDFLFGLMRP